MKITTKFVNNTATITHQAENKTVHVHFQGHGTFEDYMETMRVAEGIAKVYRSSTLLLEKHHFEDLSVSDFKLFFSTWLMRFDTQGQENPDHPQYRVALLVPRTVLLTLSDVFLERNLLRYHQVAFNIFTSEDEAGSFLSALSTAKPSYSLV